MRIFSFFKKLFHKSNHSTDSPIDHNSQIELTMNALAIVQEYLSMDTNYAILLKGKWGRGKTHFYETVIVPDVINKTSVYGGNENKMYKSARISLYGIASVDDIYDQIFLEIYPYLNDPTFKIGKGIAKALLRSTLQATLRIRDFDQILKDIKDSAKEAVAFEEIVLCFDDLERRNEQFSLASLIGFINNLVENENVKIIIIANEDKLNDFDEIKEKTIGRDIKIIASSETQVKSIIDDRYINTGDKLLGQFLLDNIDILIEFDRANEGINLRTLIYALGFYHKIFYAILQETQVALTSPEWKARLRSVLGIVLALSTDIREGELGKEPGGKNIRSIGNGQGFLSRGDIWIYEGGGVGRPATEEEKYSYEQEFIDKYRSSLWDFYMYPSVYDYMLGIKSLDIKSLLKDIKEAMPLDKDIDRHILVYQKLQQGKYYNLEDEEFMQLAHELLNFVTEGVYDLETSAYVFLMLAINKDILDISQQEIRDRCKAGMEIYSRKNNGDEDDITIDRMDVQEPPDYLVEDYKFLRDVAANLIEEADKEVRNKVATELMGLLDTDARKFSELIGKGPNATYKVTPILARMPEGFIDKLLTLKNADLYLILKSLSSRYNDGAPYWFKEEEVVMRAFYGALKTKLESQDSPKISGKLFKEIMNVIDRGFPQPKAPPDKQVE